MNNKNGERKTTLKTAAAAGIAAATLLTLPGSVVGAQSDDRRVPIWQDDPGEAPAETDPSGGGFFFRPKLDWMPQPVEASDFGTPRFSRPVPGKGSVPLTNSSEIEISEDLRYNPSNRTVNVPGYGHVTQPSGDFTLKSGGNKLEVKSNGSYELHHFLPWPGLDRPMGYGSKPME